MYTAQLRAFHAVATTGGFSRAAEYLNLTQPAVSDHVRKLEEAFEITLFNRSRRRVELTDIGKRLLEITRQQFEMEAEAIALLEESRAMRTGHLRVMADAPLHATALIADFRQTWPGITVTLTSGNSGKVLDAILAYQTDIGIMAEAPKDDRITAVPLRNDPLVALLPVNHPLTESYALTLSDLINQPMILRENGSRTRAVMEERLAPVSNSTLALETEGLEAVREAVASGIGLSLVSRPEAGSDPRLTTRPVSDLDTRMKEFVICLSDRASLGPVRAFMDKVPVMS